MMLPDEIMQACAQGVTLPAVNDTVVIIKPDKMDWDEGVMIWKGNRKLFVYILPELPAQESIEELKENFKEANQSCMLIIAKTPQQIHKDGLRLWLYNPKLDSKLPVKSSPTVNIEPQPKKTPQIIQQFTYSTELSKEDIIHMATIVLGEEKTHIWFKKTILLLNNKTPEEATNTKEGIQKCFTILKKAPPFTRTSILPKE